MVRFLSLLLLVAGVGLAFVYPWTERNLANSTLASSAVFDPVGGFRPAEVQPDETDTPLAIAVEMISRGPLRSDLQGAVLTVTAAEGGRTVLAEALDFKGVDGRITNPQTGEVAYRQRAGTVESDGSGLQINVARGDAEGVDISSVTVIVEGTRGLRQPNLVPAGYILMIVGLVGFIAGFRKRTPSNPNSSPPPPRWGRQ